MPRYRNGNLMRVTLARCEKMKHNTGHTPGHRLPHFPPLLRQIGGFRDHSDGRVNEDRLTDDVAYVQRHIPEVVTIRTVSTASCCPRDETSLTSRRNDLCR